MPPKKTFQRGYGTDEYRWLLCCYRTKSCLIHGMPPCGSFLRGLYRTKSATAFECPSGSSSVSVYTSVNTKTKTKTNHQHQHIHHHHQHADAGRAAGCARRANLRTRSHQRLVGLPVACSRRASAHRALSHGVPPAQAVVSGRAGVSHYRRGCSTHLVTGVLAGALKARRTRVDRAVCPTAHGKAHRDKPPIDRQA